MEIERGARVTAANFREKDAVPIRECVALRCATRLARGRRGGEVTVGRDTSARAPRYRAESRTVKMAIQSLFTERTHGS